MPNSVRQILDRFDLSYQVERFFNSIEYDLGGALCGSAGTGTFDYIVNLWGVKSFFEFVWDCHLFALLPSKLPSKNEEYESCFKTIYNRI
jgi:hypothetical protein